MIPSSRPALGVSPHIVSREFNAPRDLVWDACTVPEHLAKWFSPGDRRSVVLSMDFRPGGMLHYAQSAPDGSDTVWGRAVYLEIDPKDRIVYMQSFSDEHAGIASHPMAPDWPRVMHCIYRFEDLGGDRTRFTVEWTPADDSTATAIALFDSARAGMDGGWKGTLDNLENHLKDRRP